MTANDLKVGMVLVNDGTGNVLVYDNKDASGSPMLTVAPKGYIGQIVEIDNGVDGVVVQFTSDDITKAMSTLEKIEYYFVLKWIPSEVFAGAVRFADLQANVSDKQIADQVAAIKQAEDNGISFKNSIEKLAHGAADIVGSVIPWNLILLAGLGWLFITSDKPKKKISKAKISWQK